MSSRRAGLVLETRRVPVPSSDVQTAVTNVDADRVPAPAPPHGARISERILLTKFGSDPVDGCIETADAAHGFSTTSCLVCDPAERVHIHARVSGMLRPRTVVHANGVDQDVASKIACRSSLAAITLRVSFPSEITSRAFLA
jgi:hypothetical protein